MHRIAWYFKQPVTHEDMDFADDSTETFARDALKEGEQPFGVVTGYTVTPGSGLTFTVGGTDCVAYDQAGRRIRPTTFPLTQSCATATDGGSTAVSSGGNERWISIFALGGRKFSEAATDGNGDSVRKLSTECLNELGDSEHPAGAYDGVAALEAGVDRFYVVAGTEAAIGSALRPSLLEEGVLIADLHLVNGQTTLTTKDILVDRRQVLNPLWLQVDQSNRDLYYTAGGPGYGVTAESTQIIGTASLHIQVQGGRGYTYHPPGSPPHDRNYIRWGFDNLTVHNVPVKASSGGRQDLLVVDYNNQLRVLLGTEGSNVPPVATGGQVALAEIQALPSTSVTTGWPIVRRSFRRLPYPYSTMTGIIEGCRLQWTWQALSESADIMLRSTKNKIAFDGEVVEFSGGYQDDGVTPVYSSVWQDTSADPFSSFAGSLNRPYFIYACRNQFYYAGFEYGPVVLVESMNGPNSSTGHPLVDLGGPRGTIPLTDAVLIGVGWVRAGTGQRMPVTMSDDGWFTIGIETIVPAISGPGNVLLPGAPVTSLCDLARVRVQADTSAVSTTGLKVSIASHGEFSMMTFLAPATAFADSMSVGEAIFPAAGGYVYAEPLNASSSFLLIPMAFHMALPRIQFGGG